MVSWFLWLCACRAPTSPRPVMETQLGFDGVTQVSLERPDRLDVFWEAAAEAVDRYEVVADAGGAEWGRWPADSDAESLQVPLDPQTIDVDVRVEAVRGDHVDPGEGSLAIRLGVERLERLSHVPMVGVGDLGGDGDLLVVAGRDSGHSFMVFDISNPTRPELLSTVDGMGWVRDVKLAFPLLFLTGECGCSDDPDAREAFDGIGMRVFDLSNPEEPRLLSEVGGTDAYAEHRVIHNLAVAGEHVYLSDTVADAMPIFDVSEPSRPEKVATYFPPDGVVHDQVVIGDRAYVAWWKGLAVLDVSDPSSPGLLVEHATPDLQALHNIWPTEGGAYVLTSHEHGGGSVTIFEVQDPTDVREVARYDPFPGAIVHNVSVRDEIGFAAWYRNGLVAFDLADPTDPRTLATAETYDADVVSDTGVVTPSPFNGAFGVWPFGNDGVVAVSDTTTGLHLFRFWPIRVGRSERP